MIPGADFGSLEKLAIQGGHAKSGGQLSGSATQNIGNFQVGGKSNFDDIIKIGSVALLGFVGYKFYKKRFG